LVKNTNEEFLRENYEDLKRDIKNFSVRKKEIKQQIKGKLEEKKEKGKYVRSRR